MYAIVEIAGHQYKVSKDQQLFVDKLDSKEGDKVEFDRVLLTDDNGKVNVGAPAIDGAKVTAKVLEHLKDDKVTVFKKKRRKGYKVKNGHRQPLTSIQIEKIDEKGGSKKSSASGSASSSSKKSTGSTSSASKSTGTKKSGSSSASKSKSSSSKGGTTKKSSTSSKSSTGSKSSSSKGSSSSSKKKSSGSSSSKKKSSGSSGSTGSKKE